MHRILGQIKGVLMLVLLMLIATRMTWLQTSEATTDLSSTFYRTGLWVNEYAARLCKEAPEATFPLPPAMAIHSHAQPPPPSLGELSPGLALVMLARCQWTRLETDNLAHWNAWLYMAATLFSSIAVRLLTNSWTAGLLAAVAVLSRGTLQNRALLAASEPYAAPFVAASWCFLLAFLRSLWLPWIAGIFLCWFIALFFVPALWPSLLACSGLALVCMSSKAPKHRTWVSNALDRASYASLRQTLPSRYWLLIFLSGLTTAGLAAWTMTKIMPGSLPLASIAWRHIQGTGNWGSVVSSFRTFPELVGMHTPDIDWHAKLTIGFILIQPWIGGYRSSTNRAASLAFAAVCIVQLTINVWQECFIINTATLAHPVIVPAARAIEPIFIAWGTASAWRVVDVFTGYRLSSSGWSIRGRDKIKQNS